MKKLVSYLLLLLSIGLIITAPLFGQSKRIGEIVEMSGMTATFSKNQPRGTIVLEESALELWYLFNYTPAGTTLGAASKVKISADALNGIYSGSDTVPSATIATLTDFLAFDGTVRMRGKGSTSSTQSLQIASQLGVNFSVNDAGEVDSRLGYWIDSQRYMHNTGNTGNINLWLGRGAGSSASTNVHRSLGVGYNSLGSMSNGTGNIGVGWFCFYNQTGGNRLISLGSLITTHSLGAANDVCIIGHNASSTSNNQFVTGSSISPYNSYHFGRGVEQPSATLGIDGVSLNATSIQAGETNASAASFPFSINASRGTGTGVGGDLLFKFAPAGASGSSQNTLQTALQITPTTERIVSHYTHQFNDGINFNDTPTWVFKEIEIGQWNMDEVDSVIVLHGIANWQSIRDITVIVRNDEDVETRHYVLNDQFNKVTHTYYNADYFYLFRGITGLFDSIDFNAVTDGVGSEYNRGWITFWYKV